jgi:hypothetical protein
MNMYPTRLLALLASVGALASCSDGAGPTLRPQVTFNVGTRSAAASTGLAALASDPITDDAGNTLILDKVEVVLRDIRFKRVESDACQDDDDDDTGGGGGTGTAAPTVRNMGGGGGDEGDGEHGDDDGDDDGENGDGHDDGCESFNAGPFLLDLPLGAGVERVFSVAIDPGTFDKLKFKIHTPTENSADQRDIDFLLAHPEFAGVSIRATGTFNGAPFATFTSDVTARQKILLDPPIVVEGATTNVDVTIRVDIATWFRGEDGNLVNPETALAGGVNEQLVEHNIKGSFRAFRDDDHDCDDDDGGNDGEDDDGGQGV